MLDWQDQLPRQPAPVCAHPHPSGVGTPRQASLVLVRALQQRSRSSAPLPFVNLRYRLQTWPPAQQPCPCDVPPGSRCLGYDLSVPARSAPESGGFLNAQFDKAPRSSPVSAANGQSQRSSYQQKFRASPRELKPSLSLSPLFRADASYPAEPEREPLYDDSYLRLLPEWC